jgi:hypothetical protein
VQLLTREGICSKLKFLGAGDNNRTRVLSLGSWAMLLESDPKFSE